MQWIILIGDKELALDKIKKIKHYNSVSSYDVDETRYCVDYGIDHVFYDYDESVEDYEKEELSIIPFHDPHFITMIYTSEERLKCILQQEDFLKNIYIDNDHGIIVSIEKFIKMGMPLSAIS